MHDREQIDLFVRDVLDALTRRGYTESSRFAVRLALEEAISNALRHGHKHLPPDTPAHVRWSADDHELRVVITDQGPGFDPDAVPDPTLDENLERPSGRGLMLIRAYMSSVTFAKRGTEVTMVYKKPKNSSE
ncbi:ATP-binding protein [Leptolyngbya sp. 15MV]|nr:ATP-binding protein [Leptolyngbya sp. 15MV]